MKNQDRYLIRPIRTAEDYKAALALAAGLSFPGTPPTLTVPISNHVMAVFMTDS